MIHFFFILLVLVASVSLSAQQRLTLAFVGDLMQHQAQLDAARQPDGGYDYRPCFAHVRPLLSAPDLTVGNLEVTLGGAPYRGYPAFSAPDAYAEAIRDAGVDILLTANNHCLDRGRRGLLRTLSALDSLHIPSLGTYRDSLDRLHRYPLLVAKNGFRIAFLAYTYGTNGLRPTGGTLVNYIDRDRMLRDIHRARALRPDVIIACLHWGEEYRTLPNDAQRDLADWLLSHGVDHIIGAHPHVLQPLELRKDSLGRKHVVAYSLGNFLSNMSAPDTDGGALLTFTLEKSPLSNAACPQTRVVECSYSLVWTARPALTGRQNYEVLPVTVPADSLPPAARNRLTIFTKRARSLFAKHNRGLSERLP